MGLAFVPGRDPRPLVFSFPTQEDAGVADRLLLAKSKAPRWIFWDGRLRSIRAGFSGSDALFTPGELVRAWTRVLGFRPSPPEGVEETVASFFERNMGHDVLERLARPFCGGVYASDADDLSIKAAFPAVRRTAWERGAMRSLGVPPGNAASDGAARTTKGVRCATGAAEASETANWSRPRSATADGPIAVTGASAPDLPPPALPPPPIVCSPPAVQV